MKVKVKNTFCDKYTGVQYYAGDYVEIASKERINDMMQRDLIFPVKVAEETVKKTGKK